MRSDTVTSFFSVNDIVNFVCSLNIKGSLYLDQQRKKLLSLVASLEKCDPEAKSKALFLHEETVWLQIKNAQSQAAVLARIDDIRRAFLAMLAYLMMSDGSENGFTRFLKMVKKQLKQAGKTTHSAIDQYKMENVVTQAEALVATLRKEVPSVLQKEVEQYCEALPALRWGSAPSSKPQKNAEQNGVTVAPALLTQAFQNLQPNLRRSMTIHVERESRPFLSAAREIPGLNEQVLFNSLLDSLDNACMQAVWQNLLLRALYTPAFFPTYTSSMNPEATMDYNQPYLGRVRAF